MRLTSHVRFWIGGGGSNPVADHTLKATGEPQEKEVFLQDRRL